jgi:hypothetical protein
MAVADVSHVVDGFKAGTRFKRKLAELHYSVYAERRIGADNFLYFLRLRT